MFIIEKVKSSNFIKRSFRFVVLLFVNIWISLDIILLSTGGFLLLYGCQTAFSSSNKWEGYQRDFYQRYRDEQGRKTDTRVDMTLLTHRLIMKDLKQGITDEITASKAINKVNQYLNAVNQKCRSDGTDAGQTGFVKCASHVIAAHFYYTPSVEVSNNYAINRSDCDTNTYLLMDAARLHGIEPYIVYAPGHGFFAWKNSGGNFNCWETTAMNNEGEIAHLGAVFYRKTFDRSYYTPTSETQAEDIYGILIYNKSKTKPDLDAALKKYPDNAIISDKYYYTRTLSHHLSQADSKALIDLLRTDITSDDKKYALSHYFLWSGERDAALAVFRTMGLNFCGDDCYQTGRDLNIPLYRYLYGFFKWYSAQLKKGAVSANVNDFLAWVRTTVLSALLIILGGVMYGKYRE